MKSSDDSWSDFFRSQREMLSECERMLAEAERNSVKLETVTESSSVEHRITAKAWKDRWRLFRAFSRTAWIILFRGRASLIVRKSKPSP